MSWIWLVALVPIALAAILGTQGYRFGRSLPPRLATWSLTTSGAVVGLCSAYALAMIASTAIGQLDVVADIGRWGPRSLLIPGSTPLGVSIVAAIMLAAVGATALVVLARTCAIAARVELSAHRDGQFVVIDSPDADAFTLGGLVHGQIVLTTTLLDLLTAAEQAVVIAHERAHLVKRHHLFKVIVASAAALNPLLRPLRAAVDECTERWADEDASRRAGSRREVATALARVALHISPAATRTAAVSHLGSSTLAIRIETLLRPRPASVRHLVFVVAICCLSVAATIVIGLHTEDIFEYARQVYAHRA